MVYRFVFFLATLLAAACLASAQQYDFRYWSVAEGLPKAGVYTVFQDSRGYLWVGTEGGGAARFDGRVFKTYANGSGLAGSEIRAITEDSQGRLWFGSEDGGSSGASLSRYDGQSWKEFEVPEAGYLTAAVKGGDAQAGQNQPSQQGTADIRCLSVQPADAAQDRHVERLWVGTANRGLLCLERDQWVQPQALAKLPASPVRALLNDSKGRLWIGTDAGPAVLDGEQLHIFGLADGMQPRAVLCLFESRDGQIWMGTEKGVIRYDGESFYLLTASDGLVHPRVRTISQDRQDRMWFGTLRGLSRYNGVDFQNFQQENGLVFDRIRSLIVDREGNLWLGTFFGGIARFRSDAFVHFGGQDKLPDAVVRDIASRNETLALATWEGLVLIRQGKAERLDTVQGLPSQMLEAVAIDTRDRIWLGYSTGGLGLFDKTALRTVALPPGVASAAQLAADAAGNVWLLSESGLLFSTQIGDAGATAWTAWSSSGNSAEGFEGKGALLCPARSGGIWLGTRSGNLYHLETSGIPEGEPILPKPVSTLRAGWQGPILALTDAPDGSIWVGGSAGQLAHWDGEKWSLFSDLQPKIRLDIGNILVDHDGQLWLTLDRGLRRIALDERGLPESIRSYDEREGFLAGPALPGAAQVDDRGQLWFGTSRGLSSFRASQEDTAGTAPLVHLESVRLFSQREGWDQMADSLQPWSGLPHNLELSSAQNHLTFEFTGISLSSPGSVRYRYKLAGFDADWVEGADRRFATYSNLPPGAYRFVVYAADAKGRWSLQPAEFSFQILLPWWKHPLAAAGLVLLISLAFYGAVRLRTATLARSKALLRKKVMEQTAVIEQQKAAVESALIQAQTDRAAAVKSEKAKEMFLANMSHEIRTPMNAIQGMTQLLLKQQPAQSQLKYLKGIQQSSENLLVILNDILDFSKVEAGHMAFESATFLLREVLEGVELLFGHKASEKGLHFAYTVEGNVPDWLIGDSTRLTQVLVNLAGNALKFTNQGGVSIAVKRRGDGQSTSHQPGAAAELRDKQVITTEEQIDLEFNVQDTGIGIPHDRQAYIFESFTQAADNTTRLYGGTGLGLAICKQLVEQQGGQIWVTSQLGSGSTFAFWLRFAVGHPDEGQATEAVPLHILPENLRILLLEDQPFNQIVASDTLEAELPGVVIQVAENGREGLDYLEQEPYDVVLLDLGMPVMDGYQTAEAIRAHSDSRVRETPLIAMTASVTQAEIDHCFRAGMDEYIAKPFVTADLIMKILKQASRSRKAH